MIKKIYVVFMLFFSLLITTNAFASPTFSQDTSYNFKNIKTILIFEPTFEQQNISDFDKIILYQQIINYAKEKNINFISYQDYINALEKKLGLDIAALKTKEPQKAKEIIAQNAKDYADVGLYTTITTYDVTSRYVPEQHTTERRVEKAKRKNSRGYWEEYEYVVYVPRYTPAYYQPVLRATVTFSLVDLNSQKPIAQLRDPRERDSSASDTPFDMYKRIINNFFNKLKTTMGK